MTKRAAVTAAVLLTLVAATRPAQAQSWAAWEGCWRGTAADAGLTVCVLPMDDALSARIVTLSGSVIEDELEVRADNVARAVTEGGCTGTEKAFFSQDRRRVYTRAELDCNGTARVSTGVLAMVTEAEWLDVQVLTVARQDVARSVRYRAMSRADMPVAMAAQLPTDRRLAQEAARIDATAPLDLSSVTEASQVLAPPAVEALLAARNHGFDLDARRLRSLRDEGVATSTIDVIVALSYPQRFVVREQRAHGDDAVRGALGRQRVDARYGACYDQYPVTRRYLFSDRCYDGYGMGHNCYNRWGYSPWGCDLRSYEPIIVIVEPREETHGSVTRGGYTRGGESTGTGQPRDSGATTTSAGATQSTGTTGTGSTTTRTAKPRGGG